MRLVVTVVSLGILWGRLYGVEQSETAAPAEDTWKAAIQKSLPLIQSSDVTFLERSKCVSCHHQSLTAMTVGTVRAAGLKVDEAVAAQQAKASQATAEGLRESMERLFGMPGGADAVSYILLGLGAAEVPASPATDAMASFLLASQTIDGRWRIQARRPPMEASDFTVTATSIRALQLYAPESHRAPADGAIQSALLWLRRAQPASTEDRVFQLLAFGWVNQSDVFIEEAAQRLIGEQRPDGGWSQMRFMQSDAYATGSVLVSLQLAARLPSSHRSIQRGLRFLSDAQLEDGSWQVRTRSTPIQPYIESGFPHGNDQWISIAASNWATQAFALALQARK